MVRRYRIQIIPLFLCSKNIYQFTNYYGHSHGQVTFEYRRQNNKNKPIVSIKTDFIFKIKNCIVLNIWLCEIRLACEIMTLDSIVIKAGVHSDNICCVENLIDIF